jgi:hypothetical protein
MPVARCRPRWVRRSRLPPRCRPRPPRSNSGSAKAALPLSRAGAIPCWRRPRTKPLKRSDSFQGPIFSFCAEGHLPRGVRDWQARFSAATRCVGVPVAQRLSLTQALPTSLALPGPACR